MIEGTDNFKDRTSELRKKGFTGRRLGPVQMTTDTAVRVTRMVIEEQCKYQRAMKRKSILKVTNPDTLGNIPYTDHPNLKFSDHESTEMPFRYVKDKDGKPIMPEVSILGHHVFCQDGY